MKLVAYEFRKLFTQKSFLCLFFVFFLLEVGFVYMEHTQSDVAYIIYSDLYHRIIEENKDKKLEEAYEAYKDQSTFLTMVSAYEQELFLSSLYGDEMDEEDYDDAFLKRYTEFVISDEYDQMDERSEVYAYLYQFTDAILHYDQYLDSIADRSEQIKAGPAYTALSDVRKKEIDTIVEHSKLLKDQKLSDKGIVFWDRYTNSQNFLLYLSLILIISVFLFQSDEDEMEGLLMSMNQGHFPRRCAKMITLLILCVFAFLLKEILLFIVLEILYGIPEWNYALQSIPAYYTSPYVMSIGEWYVCASGIALLSSYMLGMLYGCLYQKWKRFALPVLAVCILISFLLHEGISTNSIFRVLHYINLWTLLSSLKLFRSYSVFYLGTIPVFWEEIIAMLIIAVIVISMILYSLASYQKKQNHQWKWSIHIPIFRHTSLAWHEVEKIIFCNRMFIIAVCFVCLQGYFLYDGMTSRSDLVIQKEEKLIQLYHEHGGILDETTSQWIEQQQSYYEEQKKEIVRAQRQMENGDMEKESYQQQLQRYVNEQEDRMIFHVFYDQYLKSSDVLVYTKGYEALFGVNTDVRDIRSAIFIISILIFTLHGIFTLDQQNQELRLYQTCIDGKRTHYICKWKIAYGITILLFFMFNGSEYLMFSHMYPMFQWDAPLSSIISPSEIKTLLDVSMPLWQYAILMYLTRFTGCLLCTSVIVQISKHSHHLLMSACLSMLILFVPMLLYYGGLSQITYLSIFDMIEGNCYLRLHLHLIKIAVYSIVLAFLHGKDVKNFKRHPPIRVDHLKSL